jgi:hypothetical protein
MATPRARLCLTVVVLLLALSVPSAGRQATGQISGRITDANNGPLPGVTVTVALGSSQHKTVTDASGRFALTGLAPGMYDVTAALAGFVTRTGRIDLASVNSRAYVEWSLRIGCLREEVRVLLNSRDAARLAHAVIRLRLTRHEGDVKWGTEPDCPSRWLDFSATATRVVAGKVDPDATSLRLFIRPDSGDAVVGSDYLAIVWETTPGSGVWHTDARQLLPITADGRVAAPWEPLLDGRPAEEAETLLREWFASRPNRLR